MFLLPTCIPTAKTVATGHLWVKDCIRGKKNCLPIQQMMPRYWEMYAVVPLTPLRGASTTLRILTWQLIMDKFSKTGVVPPPEKPELPATQGVVPSPDTEHVCSHASAEATQDGVLFCQREKDGRRGGTLPHKTPPFYSSQIGLRGTRERILWINNPTLITSYWLYNQNGCVFSYPQSNKKPMTQFLIQFKLRSPRLADVLGSFAILVCSTCDLTIHHESKTIMHELVHQMVSAKYCRLLSQHLVNNFNRSYLTI